MRHKYEEALARVHASLLSFWLMGDTMGVAHAYGAFAVLYRLAGSMGLLHAATNYARAAVSIYVAAGHTTGEALSRRRLGECLRDAERYDEARAELEHALRIYRALDRIHDEALVLAALAKLERVCKGPTVALELAREAKQKLDAARRQFRARQDNASFGTRYAWVYAVALRVRSRKRERRGRFANRRPLGGARSSGPATAASAGLPAPRPILAGRS